MLVIVSPGFPTNEQESTCLPHVQQFVLSLLKERSAKDICIITLQYPFKRSVYYWNGIEVRAIGGKNSKGILRILTWINAWRQLTIIKNQNNKTGLLALWVTETALLVQYFGRVYHLKRFFWLQGQDAKASNKYVRLIRPKSEQLLAISEFSRKEFYANHGVQPFAIAENGIREEIFPKLNTGNRSIDLFAAGSLIPLKNYDAFLECLSQIVSIYPNINAVHAGEGPEDERLKEKAKKLGLSKNLVFRGKMQHAEILNLMNDSKIFIHTSTYEGSSTVIAEALYSGCEVISTISISARPIERLHLVNDTTEMGKLSISILKAVPTIKRIRHQLMSDTAKMINQLFSDC